MTVHKFNPREQRLSYKSGYPKPYTLPRLTELQIAGLACVRNDEVERYEKRVGYERYIAYRSNGFDITCQIHALKKRKLIRYGFRGNKLFILTPWGEEELAQHPEF